MQPSQYKVTITFEKNLFGFTLKMQLVSETLAVAEQLDQFSLT